MRKWYLQHNLVHIADEWTTGDISSFQTTFQFIKAIGGDNEMHETFPLPDGTRSVDQQLTY